MEEEYDSLNYVPRPQIYANRYTTRERIQILDLETRFGWAIPHICERFNISRSTFYSWRTKYYPEREDRKTPTEKLVQLANRVDLSHTAGMYTLTVWYKETTGTTYLGDNLEYLIERGLHHIENQLLWERRS